MFCGLAVNAPWLLAARTTQGVAAALMVPQRRTARTASSLGVLLRCRGYLGALLVTALVFAAVYAFFFVLAFHLQHGLGWTPLRSALVVLPWSAAIPVASTLAGRVLLARFGRRVLIAGLVLMVAGMGPLAVLGGAV